MMTPLTFEELLSLANAPKLQCESVPVPEFGEGKVVWIAELNADEVDERIERAWLKHKERTGQEDNAGFRAFAPAACWCTGPERTFAACDAEAIAEAAKLFGRLGKAVTRLWQVAARLNGLTEDDAEKN